MTTPNYEQLHQKLIALPAASSESERVVDWLLESRILGIARDAEGRLEIFVASDEYHANLPILRENLVYEEWQSRDASHWQANRLRLPKQKHFDAIAAFICAHLLENEIAALPLVALRKSEPVIAMALERNRIESQALTGLIGELLVLLGLVSKLPARAVEIIEGWNGYRRSTRDFFVNGVGIEVKTSTTMASKHHIQGTYQVEAGYAESGEAEMAFRLVSVGITPASEEEQANAWSLPSLVNAIDARLKESALESEVAARATNDLLHKIGEFTQSFGRRYLHKDIESQILFGQFWRLTFIRSYDTDVAEVQVIRTTDVAGFSHVVADSVSYDLLLPNQVQGDLNPVSGFNQVFDSLSKLIS